MRRYILENVEAHPDDIAKVTADKFSVSRQAVNKHLAKLVDEKCLTEAGITRGKSYRLCPISEFKKSYNLKDALQEDVVWRSDVVPALGAIPENVMTIWNHGFTEMFNNAIDHSGGTSIYLVIRKNAISTEMAVYDDGIGIFKKIQTAMNLLDERHAILELAKGKLTTDPKNHTGEGIFFTSRMFDGFDILSGGVFFTHKFGEREDWILETQREAASTAVFMMLNNHSSRTIRKIFDQYTATSEDLGFTKTVVPVKLAQYANDQLVSRSAARRLIVRIELFKTVIFDFSGVEAIGQAFADEIFRVFASKHPGIQITMIRANSAVRRMVEYVRASAAGFPVEEPVTSQAVTDLHDAQPFDLKKS